jgi:hypothetical protein
LRFVCVLLLEAQGARKEKRVCKKLVGTVSMQKLISKLGNLSRFFFRQERDKPDLIRAGLLLEAFEHYKHNDTLNQHGVDAFTERILSLDYDSLRSSVQNGLEEQVISIFRDVASHEAMINGITSSTASKGVLSSSSNDQQRNDTDPATALVRQVGYDVIVRRSEIPHPQAGEGLFLRSDGRTVLPGTVLALFPGLVHLAEYTRQKNYFHSLMPDKDLMMLARRDDVILDARGANRVPWNPYALAHFINHPPQDAFPNVLQVPFDFRADPLRIDEFPRDLRSLVPHTHAQPPTLTGTTERGVFMHSMAIIAARPLEDGDELLMDYRLLPNGPLPEWYHHFDEEEAAKRMEEQ